jgi:exodeoxyribonuclease VII small subunit
MAKKSLSFEDKLQEFETLIDKLDQGELPIEVLLDNYERGMALAAELKSYLETSEQRIIDITKKYSDQAKDQ